MTLLAIVRHGHAEAEARSDRERRLTEKGLTAARQAGGYLAASAIGQLPALTIFHSPFVRTTQTARLLAEVIASRCAFEPTLQAEPMLLGEQRVQDVGRWLAGVDSEPAILVSHQPLVSLLAGWLVAGEAVRSYGEFGFAPASVALLQTEHGGCGGYELAQPQWHY